MRAPVRGRIVAVRRSAAGVSSASLVLIRHEVDVGDGPFTFYSLLAHLDLPPRGFRRGQRDPLVAITDARLPGRRVGVRCRAGRCPRSAGRGRRRGRLRRHRQPRAGRGPRAPLRDLHHGETGRRAEARVSLRQRRRRRRASSAGPIWSRPRTPTGISSSTRTSSSASFRRATSIAGRRSGASRFVTGTSGETATPRRPSSTFASSRRSPSPTADGSTRSPSRPTSFGPTSSPARSACPPTRRSIRTTRSRSCSS